MNVTASSMLSQYFWPNKAFLTVYVTLKLIAVQVMMDMLERWRAQSIWFTGNFKVRYYCMNHHYRNLTVATVAAPSKGLVFVDQNV